MGGSTPCPLKSLNRCISCCMSSLVLLVSTGKPNPPCSISLQRMDNRGMPFLYQLGYYNSSCSPSQDGSTYYVTQILVQHGLNRQLCTCHKHFRYLNFDTTEKLLAAYEKTLSFRVALSVGGVLSDFLPFVNQTTGSCEVPLIIDSKSCLFTGWLHGWDIVNFWL